MCCICIVEEDADLSCLLQWVDRAVRSIRYAVGRLWYCVIGDSREPLVDELELV
jgi:hypothetical protein